MRLDIREILREKGKIEVLEETIVDPSAVLADLPPGFPGPLHLRVIAQNTGSSILVRVKVRTEVDLPCSRCLALTRQSLAVDYSEEFVSADGRQGPLPPTDDPRVSLYTDQQIDLRPSVRENLLLALPLWPLCRPDCPGLCPQCGHNLNEGHCHCAPTEMVDPRLAKLAQLLDNDKDA